MFFDALQAVTALSIFLNLFSLYKLIKEKKKPQPTIEAQALLSQILKGTTVVKIDVLDPSGIFYRSQR